MPFLRVIMYYDPHNKYQNNKVNVNEDNGNNEFVVHKQAD